MSLVEKLCLDIVTDSLSYYVGKRFYLGRLLILDEKEKK